MIDESICIDKRLNAVSEGAENLFYRMLSKTDDGANIFSDPDLIKGQIYPRRLNISLEEIKKRLIELHSAKDEEGYGLITLYTHNSEMFANFSNFFKHQKLRKDINPNIKYPPRNDTLRTCNDPFAQVSKLSKQVSKDVPPLNILLEIKNLKKIYPKKEDIKIIRSMLKNMEFSDEEISKHLDRK
jgi:hypothetical protein